MRYRTRKKLAKNAFTNMKAAIAAIIALQQEIETHMADGRKRVLSQHDSWLFRKLEIITEESLPLKNELACILYIVNKRSREKI